MRTLEGRGAWWGPVCQGTCKLCEQTCVGWGGGRCSSCESRSGMAAMGILFLSYATASVCEGMCASLCLGDWQAPSERSPSGQLSLALPQRCVRSGCVGPSDTASGCVHTCVCACTSVRGWIGTCVVWLCTQVSCVVCVLTETPPLASGGPPIMPLSEAAPQNERPPPPHTHTQACRQEGSREPLGFQTRQEEGKGLASPSPASTLRGPNRGGEEGDASPTHFLSSRPSPPPASSPAASRAPPARRRGRRCVLWGSGWHSSVSPRAGTVQRPGGHQGTWASSTLLS